MSAAIGVARSLEKNFCYLSPQNWESQRTMFSTISLSMSDIGQVIASMASFIGRDHVLRSPALSSTMSHYSLPPVVMTHALMSKAAGLSRLNPVSIFSSIRPFVSTFTVYPLLVLCTSLLPSLTSSMKSVATYASPQTQQHSSLPSARMTTGVPEADCAAAIKPWSSPSTPCVILHSPARRSLDPL